MSLALRRASTGAVCFFLLVCATLITAVLVVRARTPDLVLEVLEPPASAPAAFDPRARPPDDVAITFFVREADAHALVGIVDSRERVVRNLDRDVDLAEREQVTYTWDGRTDDGRLAAPGRYRLVVDLPSEDREMIWPRRITVLEPGER